MLAFLKVYPVVTYEANTEPLNQLALSLSADLNIHYHSVCFSMTCEKVVIEAID